MAHGGGTWLVQNKVLPGAYINFSSVAKASAQLSNRGIAAAPFDLDWGPLGLRLIEQGDFQKNCFDIFGYPYDDPKMLNMREIFLHATKVYCARLIGSNAEKAVSDLATAKYVGTRGNDILIKVSTNIDDTSAFDVETYVKTYSTGASTELVDKQTVRTYGELVGNAWVDFNVTNTVLAATAGVNLNGGTNGNVNGNSHQEFIDEIEKVSFNTLCCPAVDDTTVRLYVAATERIRDALGAKFQLVCAKPDTADYEGVIGVWNDVTHPTVESVNTGNLCYWVAGAEACCAVNKSLTNFKYDGELIISVEETQSQLERAIKDGKFMFHNVNNVVRVLEDINTLVTLSDTKGELFQSNQTMRVCDQIANDVAVLFNTRYLGTVPNDKSGRMALWNDVVQLIKQLETLRAVENFDEESVTVDEGDTKKAVVLTVNGLDIVNAMSQLYMSVIVK